MSNQLIQLVKAISLQAVDAEKPCEVKFGVVTQVEPLKIKLSDRIILDEEDLILSDSVRDHNVDITISWFTVNDSYLNTTHSHPDAGTNEFDSTHKHAINGRKRITVHNNLKVGEKVAMIRLWGGQIFYVISRVDDHINLEGEQV